MVKVYSITQCPWCDKVKKYLKSRGVAYEEHNIELSDADRDECYKIFVVSFDKAKLDALLGL